MRREDEFADFVGARWSTLVRSAVMLGCPRPDAEDLVQTALLRCLRHWSKVRRADDQDAYVHRVLVNTWYSARKRHWHREQASEEVPDTPVGDRTSEVELVDLVLRSLDRLSADHRAVVVLRHYAHLDEARTAQALDVPVGTVKSRLSRAMKVLAADPELLALEETP